MKSFSYVTAILAACLAVYSSSLIPSAFAKVSYNENCFLLKSRACDTLVRNKLVASKWNPNMMKTLVHYIYPMFPHLTFKNLVAFVHDVHERKYNSWDHRKNKDFYLHLHLHQVHLLLFHLLHLYLKTLLCLWLLHQCHQARLQEPAHTTDLSLFLPLLLWFSMYWEEMNMQQERTRMDNLQSILPNYIPTLISQMLSISSLWQGGHGRGTKWHDRYVRVIHVYLLLIVLWTGFWIPVLVIMHLISFLDNMGCIKLDEFLYAMV